MPTIAELEAELERYRQAVEDGKITPDMVKAKIERGQLPPAPEGYFLATFDALKVMKDLKAPEYEKRLRGAIATLSAAFPLA